MAGGLALSLLLTLLVPAAFEASASVTSAPIASPTRLTTAAQSSGLTLTRVMPAVATEDQPVSIGGVLDVAALGIDLSAAAPTLPAPTADPGTSSPPPLEPVASVDVRLGAEDLSSHAEVSDWMAADGPATGPLLGTSDIVTAPDPTVDRIPFTVTIEGLEDRVRTPYGVVPVSVEVRLPGATGPAAVRHTFLGYQERKEYVPLRLSWLVPFTVPADPVLLGTFGEERTDAWEALVGPEGRLSEQLASARVPHTVWVLDPALLTPGPAPEPGEGTNGPTGTGGPTEDGEDETLPTAGETSTATTDATSAPGEPGPTAGDEEESPTEPERPLTQGETEHVLRAEFAQALLDAVDGRDVLLLPMHDADIAALPGADEAGGGPHSRRDLISTQLAAGQAEELLRDHGARVLPTLWPADGAWGADRDAALRAQDAAGTQWSVLTSPSSVTARVRGPVAASTGTVILPVDDRLSSRVNASGDASALETGLALMADTLVTLNDRPGTTRHVIVLPDRENRWLSATGELTTVLVGVPWVELTSLPPDGPDSGDPVDLVETASAEEQEAIPAVLEDVRAEVLSATLERLPTAASVRAGTGPGSGADLSTRGADSLAQLTSLRWRGYADDWQAAYQPLADTVAATFTGLSIPSRDVTFLADTGLLRVTVENHLDTDIAHATLDLVVDHPILRIESGAQEVQVGADSRTTVGFEASSIATGRVQITATLRAPDGTVLAEPTTFRVRVSPTSDWIYWVLLASATGIILIGVVRTVLRRRPSNGG